MADHEKQNVHPSIVEILGKGSHPPKDNLHVWLNIQELQIEVQPGWE